MNSTKPSPTRGARTERERSKLLRYCLARIRAWQTEYELYTNRPITELHRGHTRHPQSLSHEEPSMAGHEPRAEASIYQAGRRGPASILESLGGSIDTSSITTYATDVESVLPRSKPRPEGNAYSVSEKETTTNDKVTEAPVRRARLMEHLPSLVSERPAPMATVEKLRVPRVVNQVLADVPEHWQQLAQALEARVKEAGLGTLLVTSALKGEGASTVSMAISIACAQHTGLKVLLMEADFANPTFASQFRLGARVGIEHHLLENVALADTITTCQDPPLSILPALEAFEMPSVVTGSLKMEEILTRLRKMYDLVIIDLGSIFAGRKPTTLPTGVDATLIVRDPAKSSPELLDQLDNYLARHHIASLGVIENGVNE